VILYNQKCANKLPHITISCAENSQPFYSNELLKYGHVCLLPEHEYVTIQGTIGAFPKNGTQPVFVLE